MLDFKIPGIYNLLVQVTFSNMVVRSVEKYQSESELDLQHQ
jgi:hypothetical protein